ncbi:MAG: acyl-ACP--UDP-N-acetylglucosamine O-acyltransferase [Steroidobacteraceae bacterium]
MSPSIHPTAIIEDGAQLGEGCRIEAYAIIRRHATLGAGVHVHPHCVIGGDPQDLHFDPATNSGVRIGAGSVLREGVTISRATKADGYTTLGERCFLMASSHVAHDCRIGNDVIMANAALLAGHILVEDRAFLGGGAVFHQFVRIGESAMISGGSRMAQDVPPYAMAAERNEIIGLNRVGLRRRGFAATTISELKHAFRAIYGVPGNMVKHAGAALASGDFVTAEAQRFLAFFASGSRRGFARARSYAANEAD